MLVILFDEPDNDPRGGVVAEFDSPNSSFPPKSVNGVHARLPAIGFDETGVQYNAPMVGADDGFHDDAVVRGVSNALLVAEDPKTYEVPSVRRFPRSIGSRRSSQASSRCSWSVIDPLADDPCEPTVQRLTPGPSHGLDRVVWAICHHQRGRPGVRGHSVPQRLPIRHLVRHRHHCGGRAHPRVAGQVHLVSTAQLFPTRSAFGPSSQIVGSEHSARPNVPRRRWAGLVAYRV